MSNANSSRHDGRQGPRCRTEQLDAASITASSAPHIISTVHNVVEAVAQEPTTAAAPAHEEPGSGIAAEPAPCHFIKLPKELRLVIYEMAFKDSLDEMPHSKSLFVEEAYEAKTRAYQKRSLALVHTNRAFREESVEACIKVADALQESVDVYVLQVKPWPASSTREERVKMIKQSLAVTRILRSLVQVICNVHGEPHALRFFRNLQQAKDSAKS